MYLQYFWRKWQNADDSAIEDFKCMVDSEIQAGNEFLNFYR